MRVTATTRCGAVHRHPWMAALRVAHRAPVGAADPGLPPGFRGSSPRALDFRRIQAGDLLLFMAPALKTLPEELLVVLRGRRHPHIEAYWDGLAYIVP
jgi:hypothetical protein